MVKRKNSDVKEDVRTENEVNVQRIPAIARIISDPSWRDALEKMRPITKYEYKDYIDSKQNMRRSTDVIYLARLSLTDVYKILDDFNSASKK